MNKKFCTYLLFCAVLSAHAQLPAPAACYTFSGNANDGTGNGHNGTVNGATLANDRFGNPNSAYLFNGINDYIAVPNFNTIIPTDEISISFWAKANGFQSQSAMLIVPDNTGDRCGIFLYYNQSNSAYHFWDYGNIATTGRISAATTFVSQWEHFVFVSSQSQNFMAIYKNGVLMFSANHSAPLINKNKTLNIGGGTVFPFNGLIDDIAIYNQALSATEASQAYQATNLCTPPPPPPPAVPVACYPFSGNAVDATGNNHNGIVCGATLTQDRYGNANSAYFFDGIDDSIAVPNFNTMISNDEFTITFWIKANHFKSHLAFVLVPDDVEDRLCIPIHYSHNGTPYHIFDWGDISNNGRIAIPTAFVSQWEHFACVVSQSQNRMTIYKNGSVLISQNHYAPLINKNRTFNIGGGTGNFGENFFYDGVIDDIIIYDQALDASSIMNIYTMKGVQCVPTEVQEMSSNNETISVYPNPTADGLCQIHSTSPSEKKYTVYNCMGQNILSGKMSESTTLNLSKFPSGIYYLKFTDRDKVSSVKITKL